MSKEEVVIGLLIEDNASISFSEICTHYGIPQELLMDMLEYGLFPHSQESRQQNHLTSKEIRRMESAFRLHKDLEINLPGVALALELLDELEGLRQELAILKNHF